MKKNDSDSRFVIIPHLGKNGFLKFYSFRDSKDGEEIFKTRSYHKVNEQILRVESFDSPKEYFIFNLELKKSSRNFKAGVKFMEMGEVLWFKDGKDSIFLNFFTMEESRKFRFRKDPILTEKNNLVVETGWCPFFRRRLLINQKTFKCF
jgi:hypothetical protein